MSLPNLTSIEEEVIAKSAAEGMESLTRVPTIQNVVATFCLGVDNVNLYYLATKAGFVDYNPSKFAAATIRLHTPRTTALVFASGNIVCTGAKTELQSRLASRMCARLLQKIGLNVMFKNFSIQNIVASASAGYPVKLREMASEHTQASSYEPELFPGLIYRQTDPKIVFLVFRSGKIVITGARSNTVLFDNFYKFRNTVLIHYRDHFDLTTSSSMYRRSGKRLKTRD